MITDTLEALNFKIIIFVLILTIVSIIFFTAKRDKIYYKCSAVLLLFIPIIGFNMFIESYGDAFNKYRVILAIIKTLYVGIVANIILKITKKYIYKYIDKILSLYPNIRADMVEFLLKIITIILIVTVFLYFLVQMGIDVRAIIASLSIGGIVIAFAIKDTLINIFSFVSIILDNPFSKGDWIVINSVEGTIIDIRVRSTTIRTFDNGYVTVPNSTITNSNILNYTRRSIGRRIKMELNITYESGMDNIIKLKESIYNELNSDQDIAKNEDKSRDGVKDNLMVNIDKFNSSSIDILIYCFAKSTDWKEFLDVKEKLIIKIDKLVKQNKCEYAYPTQKLFLNNVAK